MEVKASTIDGLEKAASSPKQQICFGNGAGATGVTRNTGEIFTT